MIKLNGLLLNQLYIFLVYCFSWVIIGILFDVFRILRKSFKTPDFVTYLQDIAFWFLTGVFLIFVIFKFNNGEMRSYIFIGLGFGMLIYMLLFSKIFIKVNVTILKYVKIIFSKLLLIITYPFKIIAKIFNFIIIKPIKKLNNVIIFYVKKCKINKNFQKSKP